MGTRPSPIEPEGLLDELSWRAIAFGVFVDTMLTFLVALALFFWFVGPELFSESEAVASAAAAKANESTMFNLVAVFAGGLCTVAGAFAGARRAGAHFIRHGGWVAIGSAMLAAAMMLVFPGESESGPIWVEAIGILIILPCGLLGGQIAASVEASAR